MADNYVFYCLLDGEQFNLCDSPMFISVCRKSHLNSESLHFALIT